MRIVVLLIALLGIDACHKDSDTLYDSTGVATKLPSLWNTPISDDGGTIYVSVESDIQDADGNVIIGAGTHAQNSKKLIKLDPSTGKKLWEWDDRLTLLSDPTYKDPIYINQKKYVMKGNRIFFSSNTSSYCLDITTGKTIWKNKVLISRYDNCNGLGDKYFSYGSEVSPQNNYTSDLGDYVYEGNLFDEKLVKRILKPTYIYEQPRPALQYYGHIQACIPYFFQQDTLLSVLFSDPVIEGPSFRTLAGLYNYSQKKWVYEREVLSYPDIHSNITHALIAGNNVYHASGKSLNCNDVMTGKSVWIRYFQEGFGTSGFIIVNNKLYAAGEDRFLYCLDINTGDILWKEQNTGTCTGISHLNGVLYYLGGGDGLLHAVDASTGKHLWRVQSPDLAKNKGAWFYGSCNAVAGKNGKKGTIIATTGISAYAYEAIR